MNLFVIWIGNTGAKHSRGRMAASFIPELPVKMIHRGQHPIPSEDVGERFRVDIVDAGAADPGILIEDIVPLRFYDQLIVENVAADIAIPE